MATLHEKSPCCGARIIRFGGRRRQCISCRRTWRVWRRKRGRNRRRHRPALLRAYFEGQFVSLAKEASRRHMHESSMRRRLRDAAHSLLAKDSWGTLPRTGPLILLVDAIVRRINRQWYTVYLVAVKHPSCNTATLLPPVVREGRETHAGWHAVLNGLPEYLWRMVGAVVCDGHRGITDYAHFTGVMVQRCQAHLRMAIAGRRSRSMWSRHRKEGERLYRLTTVVFTTNDESERRTALNEIESLGWTTASPQLRKVISGFVKASDEYHTFLRHPEMDIPTTNNAMESLNSQFQELCHRARGFSSITALTLWVTAFASYKQYITCNGFRQPKKRR